MPFFLPFFSFPSLLRLSPLLVSLSLIFLNTSYLPGLCQGTQESQSSGGFRLGNQGLWEQLRSRCVQREETGGIPEASLVEVMFAWDPQERLKGYKIDKRGVVRKQSRGRRKEGPRLWLLKESAHWSVFPSCGYRHGSLEGCRSQALKGLESQVHVFGCHIAWDGSRQTLPEERYSRKWP